MGLGDFARKLKQSFSTPDKEKPLQQKLEEKGIVILSDTKLRKKLESLQVLFDTLQQPLREESDPMKFLKALLDRQHDFNRAVTSLASPYYRAGSNPKFRRIMVGWGQEHAIALMVLHTVADRVTELVEDSKDEHNADVALSQIDIISLVRRVHSVLILHVWQDALLVLNESFLEQDVTPKHVTVIQSESWGGGDLAGFEEPENIVTEEPDLK